MISRLQFIGLSESLVIFINLALHLTFLSLIETMWMHLVSIHILTKEKGGTLFQFLWHLPVICIFLAVIIKYIVPT